MKQLLEILLSGFFTILLLSSVSCEDKPRAKVNLFDTLNVKVLTGDTLEVSLGFSENFYLLIISQKAQHSKISRLVFKEETRELQPIFYEYASLDNFKGKDFVDVQSGYIGDEDRQDTVHQVRVNILVE